METEFRESKLQGKEQFKKEAKEPEIKNPEIAELEEPMKNIIWQMGSRRVEEGEYPIILGQDVSGRLPALLFREVLTKLYQRKGFPSPEIFPFASQIFNNPAKQGKVVQDFKSFIENNVKEKVKDKKILVVDDTLFTGEHSMPFMKVLKELNINFEMAIINFIPSPPSFPRLSGLTKEDFEQMFGAKIFLGRISASDLLIRGRNDLSGWKKSKEPKLFVKSPSEFVKSAADKQDYLQKKAEARSARRDVKILAKKLVGWYKKEMANK